jgi:hypothetical protein
MSKASDLSSFNTDGATFKNRLINGAMVIDQRNNGASVGTTTAGDGGLTGITYTLDRWYYWVSLVSKFTVQRNAGAVTPPAGFINYLGATSSSAYTVAAGETFNINQSIEGLNSYDLYWGTADAKTVTLSFWVRSSLTGTFGGGIRNSAENRSYVFSYAISLANTWEQKTITITGDITGTWLTTNGVGIKLMFSLGSGSTFTNAPGAWYAGNAFNPTGAINIVGTTGATFYITGVQFEKGTSATSFDYRPHTTELQLCQRYFYQTTPTATNSIPTVYSASTNFTVGNTFAHPVTMRSSPTITVLGTWAVSGTAATAPTIDSPNTQGYLAYVNGNNGTIGTTSFRPNSSGYLTVNAEL